MERMTEFQADWARFAATAVSLIMTTILVFMVFYAYIDALLEARAAFLQNPDGFDFPDFNIPYDEDESSEDEENFQMFYGDRRR
ncbi:hypothetical protein HNY73_011301 [Argiope bruennichi]|uniref:Uncharacterized protein n=1 Tax=Argiope bruennichi TaxID=94029 RepID=A0A8T0F3N2_ARGBR|nr:hypothetical protein HNY73_011301 [Argiope bruennichi]